MKTHKTAASSVLLKMFAVGFIALVFWAIILTVVQSAQNNSYLPMALAPVLTIAALLVWKKGRALYHRIPEHLLNGAFVFLCIAAFFAMLYFSHRMRLRFGVDTWDFTKIQIDASHKAMGTGDISLSYYAKYKNNQLLLLLLTSLFRLILWMAPNASGGVLHQWAMAVNCAAILTAVILCYCAVKRAYGTHFAFLAGLFLLFYTPLWLYTPIYYTDTLGLPLIVLPVLLLTYVKDGKTVRNIVLFCIMGIVAAIGMKIKMSILFVFLAIAITVLLFHRQKTRWLAVLSGIAALVLSAFLLQLATDGALRLTKDRYDKYQLPYSHWVMMSLGESGGYDAELVKYTSSFETMEERKAAVAEKTGELLSKRGFTGTIKHIFVTKMKNAWGDGSFSGAYYLGREPAEQGIFQKYFTQRGALYGLTYSYLQTLHLMLLFGLVLSGIRMFKNPSGGVVTAMNICIFGVLVFLLFWECNSRYLVHIAPFLVIGSAYGVASVSGLPFFGKQFAKKSEKSEKIS